MKTKFISILLIVLFSLLSVGTVSAKSDTLNVKGEVTAISSNSLSISSNKGVFTFSIPADVDLSGISVGDDVLVKAVSGPDGSWVVKSVKQVNVVQDEEEMEEEDPEEEIKDQIEGSLDNSAYCSEDKKEEPHPLAVKLAERYGVDEAWVMDTFCDGYSIGAIMLALQTSQLENISVSPEDLLSGRADGQGWGELWQDLGIIGSEKEGHSPPGQLKKPEKQK